MGHPWVGPPGASTCNEHAAFSSGCGPYLVRMIHGQKARPIQKDGTLQPGAWQTPRRPHDSDRPVPVRGVRAFRVGPDREGRGENRGCAYPSGVAASQCC
jgi:hypothetical protein